MDPWLLSSFALFQGSFCSKYLLINLKFNFRDLILIVIMSVSIIFFDNILGNLSTNNNFIVLLMYFNISFPFLFILKLNKI